MHITKKNPAARSGAHRVKMNGFNLKAVVRHTSNGEPSLAAALIADRYQLALPTARTVCGLAGLGGSA